ncbi:MAG TPA: phospholipase D-like domain-containing protein [Terriglobales bacterium]|nr:phospholipase D-like domain-containing protein [Terriglobales bacterium]
MSPTETKSAHHPRTKKHSGAHDGLLKKEFDHSEVLRIAALLALLAMVILILAGLFAPDLHYSLATPPNVTVDSKAFLDELEPLTNSKITSNNRIQVLENGENFYAAELEAMRQAQHSIDIEAYIFHKGRLTREVVDLLAQRAKTGVKVNVVLDSVGSFSTHKSYFKTLKAAGGRVEWYHRLRLHNWFMSNNRTHREITVVDGKIAFVGGAGYADWWRYQEKKDPRWRDTMVRVEGDAEASIQGTFVENWLEASGQLLDGPDYFPSQANHGASTALVVASTPTSRGSSLARVLFQMLIAGARKSILITTPYFLPDKSMREELIRARQRGVTVRVVVPGKHADHLLTRSSGRSIYGDLLKSGAEIYEYETSMIHAKITVVDGVWSVVGSTNLDNRSFGINDEINVAVLDPSVAQILTRDFEQDASQGKPITLKDWDDRGVFERLLEYVGWIFEHQQ